MKNLLLTAIATLALHTGSWAQDGPDTLAHLYPDDPVLAMLDSLESALFYEASNFTTDTHSLNLRRWGRDTIPRFSDEHFRKAIAKLNQSTPFELVYNPAVKAYIDAYSIRHREKVARFLGLAELYFPLFEETLDKYKLPLEFKYLAIVESALNAKARSRSGATGLWQFMYRTGKIYDLNTTSYVDERSDPFKATEAACQYFQYLYAMFGDWQMVLAAYNGGPGTLTKAIRRSGGKRTFWEVRPYLPPETQNYVPAFIAVNYVMTHASHHNIYPLRPVFFDYELDTVIVKNRSDLAVIARVLDVPFEHMEFLNPMFRTTAIPATERGLPIVLPKQKVGLFLSNTDRIYGEDKAPAAVASTAGSTYNAPTLRDRQTHRVRAGETLSAIASRYQCTVGELCEWNSIRGTAIREGQSLIILTAAASAASQGASSQSTAQAKPAAKPASGGSRIHVVQQGDTLWNIAKQNGLTVQELKELNGLGNAHQLQIGDKLKIG